MLIERINELRELLNNLAETEGLRSNRVLKASQKLDSIITEYYHSTLGANADGLKNNIKKGDIKMYESQFVVFAIDKVLYGIPITEIKEIINMQPPSALPDMPEYLEGIINLRGRIVSIINLRSRFNLADKEYRKESKIIILRDSSIGIHVDEVSEIRTVNDENIEALDNKLDIDGGNMTKVAKVDNQIIVIIDTNSLYEV